MNVLHWLSFAIIGQSVSTFRFWQFIISASAVPYRLVGAKGYQTFPRVKPGVGISPAQHAPPLARISGLLISALPYFTQFSPQSLQRNTVKCPKLWKDFWLLIRLIVFHPNITETVDWALTKPITDLPTFWKREGGGRREGRGTECSRVEKLVSRLIIVTHSHEWGIKSI